ncbi:MAG: ATP-binding cassette domain-containing protein, partial [Candidatus Lokiarchaeota archaeon]|nr:ATP-binding cassette domain-containing protein [Candidatus Lokiarchaeota archaeon]
DENSEELTYCNFDEETTSKLERYKVINCINLSIESGKVIGLLGNTGSGKSSLVRTFNGLIPHFYNGIFYGVVKVVGKDTINEKINDLSMDVGLVFQNPENQLVSMTVEREIAFGLENRGLTREIIKQKVDEIIKLMDIEHLRKRHPYELSGGEQQRVAVASILVLEPKVIVLDEPTSALDQKSASEIIQLLRILNRKMGITLIIIEHRLDMIISFCDELILLDKGRLLKHDSVKSILNDDTIYNMDIEIPYYIQCFYDLKQKKMYSGPIPTNIKDAAVLMKEYLEK